MKKIIHLKEKKDLAVFLNPTRHEILREMRRVGVSVTPKFLSDQLGISPSSIQFHLRKLLEIGLVELEHTEQIRGINARFYQLCEAEVHFGMEEDTHTEEKEMLAEQYLMTAYQGFKQTLRQHRGEEGDLTGKYGDLYQSITYLYESDSQELFDFILKFCEAHKKKTPQNHAWEIALLAYRMEDRNETE